MADNVLNATITADGSSFSKTLAQLEKQLKAFQAGLKNAGSAESFARLNRAAEATKARIDALRKAGTDAGNALGKSATGANQAGNALQNLGRIAQDAPFGFIGISNNINPLLESFQRLKVETGSTGGALKALAGQLGGAGGIGLAVSVVTGLLVVFGDALFGSKTAAEKAEEGIKGYQSAVEDLKASVDAVSDSISFANRLGGINVKIAGFGNETGNELTDLRQQSIAQDDAIASAQDYNKKLFNLYQERVATVKQGSQEQLDISEQYYKDSRAGDQKLKEEVNKARIIYREIALQKLNDQKAADDKAKSDREKAASDYEKYINDTISQARKLSSYLNEATFRNFDIDFNPLDSLQTQFEQARKFIERASNDRRSFNIKINATPELDFDITGTKFRESVKEGLDKIQSAVAKEIADLTKRNPILIQAKLTLQGFYDFEEGVKQRAKELRDSISSSLQNAFTGLGEVIGAAFAGQDIGGPFLNLIGDLIVQIGKALVKAGGIKEIIDKILASFAITPGAGVIAAGLAAIAVGTIIKSQQVKGQRALGGPVNAGSPYLVGERGREVFVPNTAGRIVPNSALGGSVRGGGTMQVTGRLEASGNSLVALITSVMKQQGRLS